MSSHVPATRSDGVGTPVRMRVSSRRALVGGMIATAIAGTYSLAAAQTPVAGTFPRTITDARGKEITIPAKPESVYTVRSGVDIDTVLALGVVPAGWGTFPGRGLQPYQEEAGALDNGLDVTNGPDQEALIAREIDIIIASRASLDILTEEVKVFELLGIPTVALDPIDIHAQVMLAGEALGLEDVAGRVLADFDAQVVEFRPEIMPASLSVISAYDMASFWIMTDKSTTSQSWRLLGLPPFSSPVQAPAGERQDGASLSVERAGEIDAEWVIGLAYDEVDVVMSEIPTFPSIPAVEAGRFRLLSGQDAWAFGSPDILAFPIAIAALTQAFSEA